MKVIVSFISLYFRCIFSKKSATQPKMRWIGKLELERKIRERLTDKEVRTLDIHFIKFITYDFLVTDTRDL